MTTGVKAPPPIKTAIFNLRTLAMSGQDELLDLFDDVKEQVPEILGKNYTFSQIKEGNSDELAKAEIDAITIESIIKYNKLVQASNAKTEYKNQLYIAEK